MVGVISRQKILQVLRVEGNGYVQAVMNKHFRGCAEKGIAGFSVPKVDCAQPQHHSDCRRSTFGRHRHFAESDAFNGAPGREPQIAKNCTEFLISEFNH